MTQPPGPQGPYPPQGQPPQGGGYPGQPPSGGFPQQQPGYGQQQPGYGPPSGGFPQQQQQGFGQPMGGGYPPGYDPYGQQQKSPMPWILGGVGALVVIGGVILLIVLLGGSSGAGGTPEETGEAIASAISNKDADALKSLLCDADKEAASRFSSMAEQAEQAPGDVSAKYVSVNKISDEKATVKIEITAMGRAMPMDFPLVNEDGSWLVCSSSGGSGGAPGGGVGPPPEMPDVDIPEPGSAETVPN